MNLNLSCLEQATRFLKFITQLFVMLHLPPNKLLTERTHYINVSLKIHYVITRFLLAYSYMFSNSVC